MPLKCEAAPVVINKDHGYRDALRRADWVRGCGDERGSDKR